MTVKSAQRVLELFEFFDERRSAITLKDVVDRFRYPASSASYLLKSMVSLGYLEYDLETKTYMPTMRMSVKVEWIESALFGSGSILLAMRRLHDVCAETVSLGTQSDLYAQYIHQIPTTLDIPYPRIRQTIRPIARSGLGWLLLSALTDTEVDAILRRVDYQQADKGSRVVRSELFRRLDAIRRDGYVVSRHTVVRNAGFIGMLVPSHGTSSRRLAIGVNGPVDRLDAKQESIVATLKTVIGAVDVLDGQAARPEQPSPVIRTSRSIP